jgi:hypothetical protein
MMDSFAQRAFDAMEPVHTDDLAIYLGALGTIFQEIEDYAADTDDGVGWSILVDLERAPFKGLPWLAQFKGVQIPIGVTDAVARQVIEEAAGWARGTVASVRAIIQQYLTGNKVVIIQERDSSPYHFSVTTYTSESGDAGNQAKIVAAIVSVKPAGLQFTYTVSTGQDYQNIFATYATYQALRDAYTTYQGVATNTPGT